MRLEHIPSRFRKLAEKQELGYSLSASASDEVIQRAERRLGVLFPQPVRLFYRSFNGLQVDDPHLDVLSVERLNFSSPNRLHFATLNSSRPLYFDVSHLNEAKQWDILAADGYRITLTMASFWSNKIWAWIEKRRAIWREWGDETAI